jgi:hypothetical protein
MRRIQTDFPQGLRASLAALVFSPIWISPLSVTVGICRLEIAHSAVIKVE